MPVAFNSTARRTVFQRQFAISADHPILLGLGISSLQGQVQSQDVHPWLAKESETAGCNATIQQHLDIRHRHTARMRYAFDLQGCVGWSLPRRPAKELASPRFETAGVRANLNHRSNGTLGLSHQCGYPVICPYIVVSFVARVPPAS